ncbi:MAG: VCBS repeat-containing protein [Micropruina sp.]|nr:VCBS repeat-containing protein [Micropruina sp.]
MAVGSVGSGQLALPMLSDGMNFDRPEYYETIQTSRRAACHTVQSADLDGDGQDELICRGPAGISAYSFDPVSGQWISLPSGPAWSDAAGWAQECYYATIQAADLDGDGRAELFGHGPNGTEVWSYDPTSGSWTALEIGPDPLAAGDWQSPETYSTIQCADLDGDGSAELLARSTTGIVAWKLTASGWAALPAGPGWSDAASWNLPQYYATIQCADVDGDGSAELVGRDNAQLQFWKLTPSGWVGLPFGPPMSDADGWNQVPYYSTIQFADLDGDGADELLARNNTQVLVWKLSAAGWGSLPGGPLMPDADAWNLPQYYSTIQCADIDGDGADELLARNNAQVAAWKLVGSAWQQLAGGPLWSDADGWNLPQYYSTIRTATVLRGPAAAGAAPSTLDVLIGRSAYSMLAYRYASSGWVSTTASWPVLNQQAYQAVGELLALSAGLQVRNVYNDPAALTHAATMLTAKPIPAPPSSYTGSLQVWDDTVTQLATEVGWAIAVNGWYGNVNALTNATYLDQDMGLATVCGTLELDQDSTSAALSLLSIAFNIAWAVLGVAAPIASAVAGVLATACTAAAGSWSTGPLQGDVVQLQAELTNAFTAALQLQGAQQLAITGGFSTEPLVGDYGLLAAIGGQLQSGSPAWNWDGTDGATELAAVQNYAVSCWQALVLPARWRWSVNPTAITWQNDPNHLDYVTNGWFWDLSGTGEGCNTYFTSQYGGPLIHPLLVLPATAQLLFGPDTADIGGPVYPLLVSPGDVLTAQNGWPQLTGDWTSPDDSNCQNVQPPYASENLAGSPAAGRPLTAPPSDPRLTIVPARSNRPATGKARPYPARRADAEELLVRARVLRELDGEVLVRVTVSNHGLQAADAVEIVEASLAGRAALGGLPTRPTRIGAGCRVSRQLWFPAPSASAGGVADLRVRVARRGGEHVDTVSLGVRTVRSRRALERVASSPR